MITASTQKIIPVIQQFLSSQPIERAYLFGSMSRGEETPSSDVDLLVNYTDKNISLYAISRIMVNLSKMLKRRVDLVEEDGLADFARNSVNHDKVLIYERKNP